MPQRTCNENIIFLYSTFSLLFFDIDASNNLDNTRYSKSNRITWQFTIWFELDTRVFAYSYKSHFWLVFIQPIRNSEVSCSHEMVDHSSLRSALSHMTREIFSQRSLHQQGIPHVHLRQHLTPLYSCQGFCCYYIPPDATAPHASAPFVAFRSTNTHLLHPLLLRVVEEGAKKATVQVVQDRDQEVLIELKCILELQAQ